MKLRTPVGRLVQGNCFEPQIKKQPKIIQSGPNAGKEAVEYFVAIAIEKTNPDYPKFYETILSECKRLWADLFDETGNCSRPNFAYKIIDGDQSIPNNEGKIPCEYPGFPGCWVVRCSTGYAPAIFDRGGQNRISDPNSIKRGYYIRAELAIRSNNYKAKPGIFLNPDKIEFCGYGEPIVHEVSGNVFEAPPSYMPAGMTDTPS